jgi:hypothetical protein
MKRGKIEPDYGLISMKKTEEARPATDPKSLSAKKAEPNRSSAAKNKVKARRTWLLSSASASAMYRRRISTRSS